MNAIEPKTTAQRIAERIFASNDRSEVWVKETGEDSAFDEPIPLEHQQSVESLTTFLEELEQSGLELLDIQY